MCFFSTKSFSIIELQSSVFLTKKSRSLLIISIASFGVIDSGSVIVSTNSSSMSSVLVYLSVEAFNSNILTAGFLKVSSYFPTFFDQINNVRWKTREGKKNLTDEDIIGNIEAKNIDTSTDDIDDELVETITEPESITPKDAIEMISKLQRLKIVFLRPTHSLNRKLTVVVKTAIQDNSQGCPSKRPSQLVLPLIEPIYMVTY
ncbi:hypothetical protein BpHYR1_012831 [Brachionus plicatilis]|uniref:Uncharacterized protein n=1 Tax=Brachionus plicatilis TaxID=10195 RepID=A0A3M7RJD9_BRAPC|nr:hypothetical protein BpHYR1_012831 [Brachionus plicatilis]